MKVIKNYKGEELKVDCLSCAREQEKIKAYGTIIKTNYFDAHQDLEVPIEGFIIISSRRHITGIDEFSQEESVDFIDLVTKLRKAQRKALKIESVYLIQKESSERHFHLWMFPRYAWMDEKFGSKIDSVTKVVEYAKANLVNSENAIKIEKAVTKLRHAL